MFADTVRYQSVTSALGAVTAEVASSSLVVPAIFPKHRSSLVAKRSGQTLGTRSFVHDARRIVQLHSAANYESTKFFKPEPGLRAPFFICPDPGANDSLVDQLLSLRLPQHQGS